MELCEDTHNALDEVWKTPGLYGPKQYPEARMAHLFTVIAGALGRYVQHTLGKLQLWTSPFSETRAALSDGTRICEKWNAVTTELSDTYWRRYDEHRWEGGVHKDSWLDGLAKRLDEVLRVRTTHEELRRLLTAQEQKQLHVYDAFAPFEGTLPLHYNPYTQPEWQACVAAYERKLEPIENHIAGASSAALSPMPATLFFLCSTCTVLPYIGGGIFCFLIAKPLNPLFLCDHWHSCTHASTHTMYLLWLSN